jgi:hypothetical protein
VAFFQWLEHASWVTAISGSPWMYPTVEVIHFFSFFLLVGTIAVIDLRLLGLAGRRQPASQLAEQLFPWTWTGLGLAALSGFIMFSTEATGFVANTQFRIKMLAILLAVLFALIVQWNARKWDQASGIPIVAQLTAVVSLALWIGVILAATEIGNYSGLG